MKEYPTQEQIKQVLDYNQETGVFIWKPRPVNMFKASVWQNRNCKIWNTRFANTPAGCSSDGRYITIRINEHQYWAHRLAYIYVHGGLPDREIDHINRNGCDNRIVNLRCVNRVFNQRNVKITTKNSSGVVGVSFDKQKSKWQVLISASGKHVFVGRFIDFDDAVKARYEAEKKYGFTDSLPDSTAKQYLQEAAQ